MAIYSNSKERKDNFSIFTKFQRNRILTNLNSDAVNGILLKLLISMKKRISPEQNLSTISKQTLLLANMNHAIHFSQ